MKHDDVIASLKRHAPYLQDAVHREIAAGLAADGLLDHDGAVNASAHRSGHRFGHLTAAEAAEPSDFHAQAVARVIREMNALGWSGDVPTDKPISVAELDSRLKPSRDDDTITRRMTLKTEMSRLGMIP